MTLSTATTTTLTARQADVLRGLLPLSRRQNQRVIDRGDHEPRRPLSDAVGNGGPEHEEQRR